MGSDDEEDAEDEDDYYYEADAQDGYPCEDWWLGFSQCESDTILTCLDVH